MMIYIILFILQYKVSTTVMDLVVVFASFVFMLALLCFCVAAVFSVNKDLYKINVATTVIRFLTPTANLSGSIRATRAWTTVTRTGKTWTWVWRISRWRFPTCVCLARAPGSTSVAVRSTKTPSNSPTTSSSQVQSILKIFISPEWTYSIAKQTENNKLTN